MSKTMTTANAQASDTNKVLLLLLSFMVKGTDSESRGLLSVAADCIIIVNRETNLQPWAQHYEFGILFLGVGSDNIWM